MASMTSTVPLVALAGGVLSLAFYSWHRSKRSVPLPPGPSGNIIFGNALEVRSASAFWLKFAEYSNQYGPIITIRLLHMYHIVVSDPRIVFELFDKRAANYSDRPLRYMINLLGWDKDTIIFLNYGPRLKYYRTLLQRALNNRVAPDYLPLQQYEVRRFMRRLADNPAGFLENVHHMSASIAVRMAYGHKVESLDDRFVQIAEEIMVAFSDALRPAKWAVDIFPPLRYVPSWFPFANFRRQIQAWQRLGNTYRDEPFEFVEKQMAAGIAEDSFTSKLLQLEDGTPVDDETKQYIKALAASLYGAGSDTTVSIIQSFFLAMTLYPDVQAKAQAEITTYLKQRLADDPSSSRFLTLDDRSRLPYTSALVRELLRWHPVANIIPHQSGSQDDENVVSEGKTYRIPANTLVIVNSWQILHNPEVYHEPERFMPGRYLVANPPPDPESYAFGFGRRICPGIHFAQQSMWLSISNTLANFNITKAKDENGAEITPDERYTNDIISHPLPFVCCITPKEGCEEWLREEFE
ncbi:hypothetical protein FRC06_007007 [Ceratobasidium sp. 370]|nr:hypothetical protein FRC06_007007 [Ceratobasidium sp. 370]